MSPRRPQELETRRRALGPGDMARISPLPPPEEIFADWLLSVPHDADIGEEAMRQVELIDARAIAHPDVLCLRSLLLTLAGGNDAAGLRSLRRRV